MNATKSIINNTARNIHLSSAVAAANTDKHSFHNSNSTKCQNCLHIYTSFIQCRFCIRVFRSDPHIVQPKQWQRMQIKEWLVFMNNNNNNNIKRRITLDKHCVFPHEKSPKLNMLKQFKSRHEYVKPFLVAPSTFLHRPLA